MRDRTDKAYSSNDRKVEFFIDLKAGSRFMLSVFGQAVANNMATSYKSVLQKSTFSIPKTDCPSEESLIRMALAHQSDIQSLKFDLGKRELQVVHYGGPAPLLQRLASLKLGATLRGSESQQESGSSEYRESIFSVPKMDCASEKT